MKNRISKHLNKKSEKVRNINTFFLACEFKPGGPFFSVIEPFVYDIKPAFTYGTLGILGEGTYSIVEIDGECQPLMGFIMTITNPETALLLDRIKGCYGENTFNLHLRKVIPTFTSNKKRTKKAWGYLLSNHVLNLFQSIQSIEFGIYDNDKRQVSLLEKILEQ